ncbi:hypothetical protein IR083_10040 [Dysgonomonas sp. GY75]|uniref:hypothetical protein n=1 Tax=Dysgonomonas sp. GY75 TaxID=2780419 RepID=UPI0018845A42|nr:hypothetical protein [Dysgonomonas sp. GY75]MBF0649160.1 hypothetical protein [Dysgonomonas sp. GY75]
MSYINLINDFWDQNEIQIFKAGEQRLYFYILKVLNKSGWRKQVNRTNAFIQGELGMSYNSLKRAREGLRARGMIHFKSKNGVANVIYSLEPFADENPASGTPADSDSGTDTTPPPSPDRPIKKALSTLLSDSPPSETYSPDKDNPPDDGIDRNWPDLKRNLNELKVLPGDYQKIVQLSNYGRISHPVWKAFHEISRRKGSKDAVKNPGSWILWYIKENPPVAAAPAVPAPSTPPPEPPAPDIDDFIPPDDGAERDWEKLKSRLKELQCPWRGIQIIGELSGYGKTDSPVWDALEKSCNRSKPNIKSLPHGAWIIDYIRKNSS